MQTPLLAITRRWTFDQGVGYLNTWSAVQHHKVQNKVDPLSLVEPALKKKFGVLL